MGGLLQEGGRDFLIIPMSKLCTAWPGIVELFSIADHACTCNSSKSNAQCPESISNIERFMLTNASACRRISHAHIVMLMSMLIVSMVIVRLCLHAASTFG